MFLGLALLLCSDLCSWGLMLGLGMSGKRKKNEKNPPNLQTREMSLRLDRYHKTLVGILPLEKNGDLQC